MTQLVKMKRKVKRRDYGFFFDYVAVVQVLGLHDQ